MERTYVSDKLAIKVLKTELLFHLTSLYEMTYRDEIVPKSTLEHRNQDFL